MPDRTHLIPPNQGCTLPPKGWYCSREPGHPGPCAAYPKAYVRGDCMVEELERMEAANARKLKWMRRAIVAVLVLTIAAALGAAGYVVGLGFRFAVGG